MPKAKKSAGGGKAKGRPAKKSEPGFVNGERVTGGWDELPHNMGSIPSAPTDDVKSAEGADNPDKTQSSDVPKSDLVNVKTAGKVPAAAKAAPKKRASRKKPAATVVPGEAEDDSPNSPVEQTSPTASNSTDEPTTPPESAPLTPTKTPKKRAPRKAKAKVKKEEDSDYAGGAVDDAGTTAVRKSPRKLAAKTPQKAKVIQQPSPESSANEKSPEETKISPKKKAKKTKDESDFEDEKPKKNRAPRKRKADAVEGENGEEKPAKKAKSSYGIMPGQTPFPDWPLPTKEACEEVNHLLSEKHGVVIQPASVPAPSLTVTGCGEVPSVLDALIRTRLSAATTGQNSKYAFMDLTERFGVCEEGIGKGSVNWNKVREADVKEVEKAIHRGGLAPTKSKSIKEILDMVHDQNMARRQAFIEEKENGVKPDVVGADRLTQDQKDLEIAAADYDVLSLQFMHGLTADEAMQEFVKYPGIGVKTASCVILFCLQRPSFAVDTHVYRLCRWLKWIPEKATRDQAFSHCEVRIPNELKYSLHQLFIKHGKVCGRCRAATSETSDAFKEEDCPIEHLVERTGKRKMLKAVGILNQKKAKKSKKGVDEDSDLSDLDDAMFDDAGFDDKEAAKMVDVDDVKAEEVEEMKDEMKDEMKAEADSDVWYDAKAEKAGDSESEYSP